MVIRVSTCMSLLIAYKWLAANVRRFPEFSQIYTKEVTRTLSKILAETTISGNTCGLSPQIANLNYHHAAKHNTYLSISDIERLVSRFGPQLLLPRYRFKR
jgi:hypothetical protein